MTFTLLARHLKLTANYYNIRCFGNGMINTPGFEWLQRLLPAQQGKPICGAFDGFSWQATGKTAECIAPSQGSCIAEVQLASSGDYERVVSNSVKAYDRWCDLPVPFRGEVVRKIGLKLREEKGALGKLISLEMGKILAEGEGEVQEVIDICDYATGLSRMLNGKLIPSERPQHMLLEAWNPIGVVGVITAFNFPVAVLGWNLAIALVCGNTVLWKGAETTKLVTIAVTNLINSVLVDSGVDPAVFTVVCGDSSIGEKMTSDHKLPMISFTGSTRVGKEVQQVVHSRFGRCLLELSGNNAIVVDSDADIEMVVRAVLFASVGTAGQRCTTTRRLLVHTDLISTVTDRLATAYSKVRIGDSLEPDTLLGPLHSKQSKQSFLNRIEEIKKAGGNIVYGGNGIDRVGHYVEPTLVTGLPNDHPIVQEETFAPILYIIPIASYSEGVKLNNSVKQGLSSSLFTKNISNIHHWLGPHGSDCGIVNVNIPTNGAEIGGAFGGEKETGGGRESGSDAWKQYMRRSTCTINCGNELPLAQGIKFD